MQISLKNEALSKVISNLQAITPKFDAESRKLIEQIIASIDDNIQLDSDWERFVNYFDQVHGSFLSKMKQKYPKLTTIDLKLCACLRMKLSTKEIASLINISVRGVEKARYRLRKKISIDADTDLVEFIGAIV
jgi:DNA-binding CsgD family transcriptional regulator